MKPKGAGWAFETSVRDAHCFGWSTDVVNCGCVSQAAAVTGWRDCAHTSGISRPSHLLINQLADPPGRLAEGHLLKLHVAESAILKPLNHLLTRPFLGGLQEPSGAARRRSRHLHGAERARRDRPAGNRFF
jgi:hypothetical protein